MKNTIFLLVTVLSINVLSAQKLTIKVTNIEPIKGNLMIGVYNNEKDFMNTHFRGKQVKVTDKTMTVTFTDLPQGVYAIAAYHDENENNQLDKNLLGVPKEKYGSSNNQNRPSYKKCAFKFDEDMTINIRLSFYRKD